MDCPHYDIDNARTFVIDPFMFEPQHVWTSIIDNSLILHIHEIDYNRIMENFNNKEEKKKIIHSLKIMNNKFNEENIKSKLKRYG